MGSGDAAVSGDSICSWTVRAGLDVAVSGDSICSWTVRAGLDFVAGGEFSISGDSFYSWNMRVGGILLKWWFGKCGCRSFWGHHLFLDSESGI